MHSKRGKRITIIEHIANISGVGTLIVNIFAILLVSAVMVYKKISYASLHLLNQKFFIFHINVNVEILYFLTIVVFFNFFVAFLLLIIYFGFKMSDYCEEYINNNK